MRRDLGKIVRFVGVNLLFATSPLYPPFFTEDRIPNASTSTSTPSRAGAGVNASAEYIKLCLFLQELAELPAGYTCPVDDWTSSSRATSALLRRLGAADAAVSTPPVDYPAYANLFLAAGRNTSASSTESRTTRRR